METNRGQNARFLWNGTIWHVLARRCFPVDSHGAAVRPWLTWSRNACRNSFLLDFNGVLKQLSDVWGASLFISSCLFLGLQANEGCWLLGWPFYLLRLAKVMWKPCSPFHTLDCGLIKTQGSWPGHTLPVSSGAERLLLNWQQRFLPLGTSTALTVSVWKCGSDGHEGVPLSASLAWNASWFLRHQRGSQEHACLLSGQKSMLLFDTSSYLLWGEFEISKT